MVELIPLQSGISLSFYSEFWVWFLSFTFFLMTVFVIPNELLARRNRILLRKQALALSCEWDFSVVPSSKWLSTLNYSSLSFRPTGEIPSCYEILPLNKPLRRLTEMKIVIQNKFGESPPVLKVLMLSYECDFSVTSFLRND